MTRLTKLTLIPIFTDEAIYLRWAQIALGDPRWRFISLIDGKQPLLIWLFLPFVKYISDPLVAGRIVRDEYDSIKTQRAGVGISIHF